MYGVRRILARILWLIMGLAGIAEKCGLIIHLCFLSISFGWIM
ncbi:unnamed protein product [Linum tenue]|uniref:Uncharacterized protein n=1 Tax=Linum tenue TaxID=586396 RepID=A0AAV0HGJ7_9ROSI|nr:unnamed protein product [Linum tenue]